MNSNEIFRTYLNDPLLADELKKLKIDKSKITLAKECDLGIIQVIKTAVMNLDESKENPDNIARKINKLFRNV